MVDGVVDVVVLRVVVVVEADVVLLVVVGLKHQSEVSSVSTVVT